MKNFLVPLLCLTATSSALAVAPRHAAVEESGLAKRSVGRVAGMFIQFLRGTKAGERTEGRLDHLGVGPARPYVCYWKIPIYLSAADYCVGGGFWELSDVHLDPRWGE